MQQKRDELLTAVPRVASELFVGSTGLVKEAAHVAWRELGEYTSDETITSLCASISGGEPEDEDENEKIEEKLKKDPIKQTSDSKEDKGDPADAAREPEGRDDSDDGADSVVLDGDDLFEQLVGDERQGSLLGAFAASALEDFDTADRKITKRQQMFRQRQEETTNKIREVELLSLFLDRYADKKAISVRVIQNLFEVFVDIGRKCEKKDTLSKAHVASRRIEGELGQRIGAVLSSTLKLMCRGAGAREVCAWRTANEWAEHARQTFMSQRQVGPSGRAFHQVAALLVYWLCVVHRASVNEDDEWALAEELLSRAIQDWSAKKDADSWCHAVLQTFANRVPILLFRKEWCAQIKESRNAYSQRSQVAFITKILYKPEATNNFVIDFVHVCLDLLAAVHDGEKATQGQKQKLQVEVLQGMGVALRILAKRSSTEISVNRDRATTLVTGIKEALPSKQGKIYQLCVTVLRAVACPSDADGGKPSQQTSSKRRNSGDVCPVKRPRGGDVLAKTRPEVEPPARSTDRGAKQFFEQL